MSRANDFQTPNPTPQTFAKAKAFNCAYAGAFLKNLDSCRRHHRAKIRRLLAPGSSVYRPARHRSYFGKRRGQSALLPSLGGHPASHILAEEFFTQVPIRYGDYIAKLGLFPATPEQASLAGSEPDLGAELAAHRKMVRSYWRRPSGLGTARSVCTDLKPCRPKRPVGVAGRQKSHGAWVRLKEQSANPHGKRSRAGTCLRPMTR